MKCCNLASLYSILYGSTQSVMDFFAEMQLCPDLEGTVRLAGEKFESKFRNGSKPAESYLTYAQEAVAIYNPATHLGKSVVNSDFDITDLKNPDTPTTVHIIIPPEQAHLVSSFAGLCLNTLLTSCIEANRFEPRVTVVADEFENLSDGPIPAILPTLKLGRSRGVQLFAYIQDISGLRSRYEEDWTAFLTQTAIQVVGTVKSTEDAEMWSKKAGQRSIITDTATMSDDGGDYSIGIKEEGVPSMRPDAFQHMPEFTATLFFKQNPPMVMDLIHYKMADPWVDEVDAVPGVAAEPDFPIIYKA